MSKIRTIKPDFWTSEQIAKCSRNARLFFIGLWNFCDDGGVCPVSLGRLKVQIFPFDVDLGLPEIEKLVQELALAELISIYEVNKNVYLKITGWHHQYVQRAFYKFPQPDGKIPKNLTPTTSLKEIGENENCTNIDKKHSSSCVQAVFKLCGEGKGEGSKHKNLKVLCRRQKKLPNDDAKILCPQQEILDLYHELLPGLPKMRIWHKTREANLRRRWADDSKRQNLDFWRKFFEYIGQSDFLCGKVASRDGQRVFVADLEWIVKPANFAKIVEGKYHRS